MTLIIAILSKHAIHISSDFQLKAVPSNKPLPYDSPKEVGVNYSGTKGQPSWTGRIVYAGVGKANNEETSLWIVNQLRNQRYLSFDQLAVLLSVKGSTWLKAIGYPRHSFFLAGFVNKKPRFALISNFQKINGLESVVPNKELGIEKMPRNIRGVQIIMAGLWRGAVTREDKQILVRLAKENTSAVDVRKKLASVNLSASQREKSEGISPSCLTYSLLADGTGGGELNGKNRTNLIPYDITNGHVVMGPEIMALIQAHIRNNVM